MLPANSNFEGTVATERDTVRVAPDLSAMREAASRDPEAVKVPILGKTLLFRGELTAEEDVILQGRVEGSIRHARNLVIGTDGSVLGDVYARHLTVEGLVEGDLRCSEAVVVQSTAQVRGNIYAPRVGIMEGATFNGSVEMDSAVSGRTSSSDGLRPSVKAQGPARSAAAQTPPAGRQGAGALRTPITDHAESASAAALPEAAVDRMLNPQSSNKK